MKRSIISLWFYFLAVLLLFLVVQKPFFFLYNWDHGASACSLSDVWQMYVHGFRLDLATSAYISAIPLLLIIFRGFVRRFPLRKVWIVYNAIMALVLSLITTADASLYEFWEFKLDATVFMYIGDPKNIMTSVTGWYIVLRVLIWLVLAVIFFLVMNLPIRKVEKPDKFADIKTLINNVVSVLLSAGLLFVFIRGVDIWPNNPGVSFYSKVLFHNHTALNPAFNMLYSITRTQKFSDQYQTLPQQQCEAVIEEMYPRLRPDSVSIVTKPRPNVLVILLEGMGACFVESLGGDDEVAPNISRISQESINFTNAYCSSFRTDRGVVAAISGYPGQPNTSIMRYSNKVQNLPGLPKSLKEHGYDTGVLYASDASFFNMSGYFLTSGHDKMVTEDDFSAEERSTKWGAPDHVAFKWMLSHLQEQDADKSAPHYNTMLTISSHTPFDVPYHRLDDEKKNSFAYTDSCFGDFIDSLRISSAWDNLMVVVTADHGFNHEPMASPNFAHVPFFILGGAVDAPKQMDMIVDQTDLPAIVLSQLGYDYSDFTFSRNVLSPDYTDQWAINVFNDGFTFFDPRGATVYLNQPGEVTFGPDSLRVLRGKAFLQNLYQDLDKR